MKRFLLWCGVAVAVCVLVAYLSAPAIVRWKIRQTHPEVTFQSSHLGWTEITLHGVQVNTSWLQFEAGEAHVGLRTHAVRLLHGTVNVNLDLRPPSKGPGSPHAEVTAEDFTVHVTKGQTSALLRGVSADASAIRFDTADVEDPQYGAATLTRGEIQRDLSNVRLDHLDLVRLAPQFAHGQTAITATLTDIMVSPKEKLLSFRTAGVFDVVLAGQKTSAWLRTGYVQLEENGGLLRQDVVHVKLPDGLSVFHPWLAKEPVVLKDVEVIAPLDLKGDISARVGPVQIPVDPEHMQVSGAAPCESWAEALPSQLRSGPLATPDFSGDLSFDVGLHPPSVQVHSTCKSACTSPAISALRHEFTYTAYDKEGMPFERTTGPSHEDWVKLSDISPSLPMTVIQLEDPGFKKHHGFIANALQNSLIADVKAGRFSRGGSTITMQTAKNVWLRRDKTFGRKIEELLLSTELESCFSKDTILETYLNVVEFGPNIYGVQQAANEYFGVDPIALDARQSMYLAWVLPRPRKAPPPNDKTMQRMTALLSTLAAQGRLPDAMLLDAENAEAADTTSWVAAP